MKLYRIANWAKHFENNRSKAVENTRWVPMPNRHDGENFTRIMRSKHGATVYAAWVLMVQVASKCEPRGTLAKTSGTPHDPVSLSLKTGAPESWFVTALEFIERETDWLVVEEVASGRQADVSATSGGCQSTDVQLPRKKEGKEENGMEENGTAVAGSYTQARIVLHSLNEAAGRHYRETEANLDFIRARLSEPDVTVDGCIAMIRRQVARWGSDPKMSEYLRPETLFNRTKFDAYYAARDLPATAPETAGGRASVSAQRNAMHGPGIDAHIADSLRAANERDAEIARRVEEEPGFMPFGDRQPELPDEGFRNG